MKLPRRKILLYTPLFLAVTILTLIIWQSIKKVPTEGNWKTTLAVLSTAEFNGDRVTVKNVRNFEYDKDENVTAAKYEDRTYDLNKLSKVWFISSPFDPGSPFAHTFLSFEFEDSQYLAITIEARLTKEQKYTLTQGALRTYPLMYIAADERDVIYMRTTSRGADVYLYPLKATPLQGKVLLTDMLNRMNEIAVTPTWYNAFFANCTSSIAGHVNKIWPGVLPGFDWQSVVTGYADKLALESDLIDTTLSIDEAREKYYVSDISKEIGRVENYSKLIRQ